MENVIFRACSCIFIFAYIEAEAIFATKESEECEQYGIKTGYK